MKQSKNYLSLILKGAAMGAADVIPGVSGGTIAFITGIYEELINSIKSINGKALKMLLTLDLKGFWKQINGNFLMAVVGGILISIFSLAKLMKYLLETHPIFVWSFFFGLIIAAAILVSREIKAWDAKTIIALIFGTGVAYAITVLSPAETPDTWWFIMLSGAIAICAMILPGISGAFILLLLGKYEFIIDAVANLNIGVLLLFAVGAVTGIIAFSHFLSWLLKNYHNMTVALLMGFMVGSLNKIWPWKDFGGDHNVLPQTYAEQTGEPALLGWAVVMMLSAFVLIWGLERIAAAMSKRNKSVE